MLNGHLRQRDKCLDRRSSSDAPRRHRIL